MRYNNPLCSIMWPLPEVDMLKRISTQARPFSLPSCGLVWFVLLTLSLPRAAEAVIVYGTGDPTHNTTAPGGALTNSGWQYQGQWGVSLGAPISTNFFITAAHVGGAVGDIFHFRGV